MAAGPQPRWTIASSRSPFRSRCARPRRPAGGIDRHDPRPPRLSRRRGPRARRSGGADRSARHGAEIRGPLPAPDQERGPISMLVVDFNAPDVYRAVAHFDAERLAEAEAAWPALDGRSARRRPSRHDGRSGHGDDTLSGVVALTRQSLEEAAHQYFRQSEQIPSRVRLGVGSIVTARAGNGGPAGCWCSSCPILSTGCGSRHSSRRRAAGPRDPDRVGSGRHR